MNRTVFLSFVMAFAPAGSWLTNAQRLPRDPISFPSFAFGFWGHERARHLFRIHYLQFDAGAGG